MTHSLSKFNLIFIFFNFLCSKRFLFDFADKDKNNYLDQDEILEIFGEMPSEILNNQNALQYALKELKKSNGFLNRDQFLELIYKIRENICDDDED